MSRLLDRIGAGEILVGDGAMGTFLMSRGLEGGQCPDALNLTRTELLVEIAAAYAAAGSDIVVSNTFGATTLKLAPYGLEDEMEAINRAGVQAAREGAGDKVFVSGDMGPTGRLLKPYGDTEPGEIIDAFRRQASVLAVAGVDAFSIETMTDLREAGFAVRAAKEVAPQLPVLATMTFERTPRGYFSIMGTSVEQAVEGLAKEGADVVGSNCGHGSEEMLGVAQEFARHSTLPLIIQANAGLPVMEEGRMVFPESPEFMAEKAAELVELGVKIVGGCCGSTPDHIRAIRAVADAAMAGPPSDD